MNFDDTLLIIILQMRSVEYFWQTILKAQFNYCAALETFGHVHLSKLHFMEWVINKNVHTLYKTTMEMEAWPKTHLFCQRSMAERNNCKIVQNVIHHGSPHRTD